MLAPQALRCAGLSHQAEIIQHGGQGAMSSAVIIPQIEGKRRGGLLRPCLLYLKMKQRRADQISPYSEDLTDALSAQLQVWVFECL